MIIGDRPKVIILDDIGDTPVSEIDAIYDRLMKKVEGPIYGGILEVYTFGVLVYSGSNEGAINYYYGCSARAKQLVESHNGKRWIRDERFG